MAGASSPSTGCGPSSLNSNLVFPTFPTALAALSTSEGPRGHTGHTELTQMAQDPLLSFCPKP